MSKSLWISVLISSTFLLAVAAVASAAGSQETATPEPAATEDAPAASSGVPSDTEGLATAVFAGGCFWCMEEAYEQVPGVKEAVSGYAGGDVPNPGYRQVVSGTTGHYEVVRVYYDPETVTYEELLHVFWRNVDPIDPGGQFCDRGSSYLSGIFTETDEQRRLALASREEVEQSGRFTPEIVTPVLPLDVIDGDENDGFWIAEEYHQDYYRKNALQYRFYKEGCGRVRRLEQLWGDEAGAPAYQILDS